MSQFDGDRESAISQDTHWHQFFECFNDLMNGSCRRFDGHSVVQAALMISAITKSGAIM